MRDFVHNVIHDIFRLQIGIIIVFVIIKLHIIRVVFVVTVTVLFIIPHCFFEFINFIYDRLNIILIIILIVSTVRTVAVIITHFIFVLIKVKFHIGRLFVMILIIIICSSDSKRFALTHAKFAFDPRNLANQQFIRGIQFEISGSIDFE